MVGKLRLSKVMLVYVKWGYFRLRFDKLYYVLLGFVNKVYVRKGVIKLAFYAFILIIKSKCYLYLGKFE